ncbi:amidohydrolase family protein [Roseivirga sp. E12]|uniref:metal-dependent hydrolase family protein n=1 Tax=Roseivirga sp. E12 TaxID=2819237 RepID=UPI001ABC6E7F|nr:amidohydrolase family protein [Roseivirga sp. E12]MBO3698793.1 amidohydrolase family protein [Roseivirga sp. E12]
MRKPILFLLILCLPLFGHAQVDFLLKPDRVFDGVTMHDNWVVAVKGNEITYAGPDRNIKAGESIKLKGMTLMPGLIEGHSHILLHPYNETSWNDQVLKESWAERSARAVNHLRASLMAGVTTMRDLGSEGAGYTDVGMKQAVQKGVIPGPRLLVAGKAIVATGSYGPKGFHEGVQVPLGAETADGFDDLIKVTRDQIGHGADFIKVYADYRWGPNRTAEATFTVAELKTIVEIAESSGRYVVAHASSPEGMRRAIEAGVETIEHGDGGTPELFALMAKEGIGFCPTLAAGDAITQYGGWNKDVDPEPTRIVNKRKSFKMALDAGVKIVFGGDVGVFTHGDNVRELEMMVGYGMSSQASLESATSLNADMFHLDRLGQIKEGFLADIIVVEGNPLNDISNLRKVNLVMKNGVIYKRN